MGQTKMTVFVFELSGKFAHWKKFYTNSSSLTYYFPPRTSIIGIIASVLEMNRDSYYERFNKENLDVGVALKTRIKRKITSVNYINTKDKNKGHTQIKLEALLPLDLKKEKIVYKIYLRAKNEKILKLIKTLKEKVKDKKLGYGVYLGQRQFRGDLTLIGEYEEKEVENAKEVLTVCLKKNIQGTLEFDNSFFVKDLMPCDFNSKREIKETEEILCNLNGTIKLKSGKIKGVYQIAEKENICFM